MDNPGAKLKLVVDDFMGEVIKAGYEMAADEFAYRRFRKLVLDQGNQLIRDFNTELATHKVHFKVTKEQVKDAARSQQDTSA